jgi:lipopolysaccharide export system protein LptA
MICLRSIRKLFPVFTVLIFIILCAAPCHAAGDVDVMPAEAQYDELHIRAGELAYDEAADTVAATDGVWAQYLATQTMELRAAAMVYQPEAGVLSATQGVTVAYGAENPVLITAGSVRYDRDTDLLAIAGTVNVTQDEWKLSADAMLLDRGANTFAASGPVVIVHGGDTIRGRDLAYDHNTGLGFLQEACGCYRGVNIKGENVSFSTGSVTFHNAVATTCAINGSMDYRIEARSVTVTPDNRAHFKHLALFVKNTRVFSWKSYIMAFGAGSPRTESAQAAGAVRIKPMTMGYNDAGGVFGRTGLTYNLGPKSVVDFNTHYYLTKGFFAQLEANRMRGQTRTYFKMGKEFKENTGYFRYMSPVVVWNQPTVGVDFGRRMVPGTRLSYALSAEAGRLKEQWVNAAKNRALIKIYARYPLTPKRKVVFSLVGDARYAFYTGSREYRVAGVGAGMDYVHGGNAKHTVSLQYLHFDPNGRTFFVSDVVDTNDKLYFGVSAKATQKTRLRVDGEYDLNDSRLDEVEYMLSRTYECVTLDLGYRKELKSIMFRVNILGFKHEEPSAPQAAPEKKGGQTQ